MISKRLAEMPKLLPLLLVLLTMTPLLLANALSPDLVVLNANVISMDPSNGSFDAFAVLNGRIVETGDTERIEAIASDDTDIVNVEGMTVVPGFIDAHMHPRPVYPVEHRLGEVDCSPANVSSIDELIIALRAKAKHTPEGEWVRGSRYQDTKLGRHPTREDLDRASMRHPIIIGHSSGHISACNSLALELAGIDMHTADPPGGKFDRDDEERPNGVLREGAAGLVRAGGPPFPAATAEEELGGLQRCFENFARKGITTIHDAGIGPKKFRLYRRSVREGLPARVVVMFRETHLEKLSDAGMSSGFGDDWLKIGPIKLFHGNSLSGRTCWLYEPYDSINPETGKKDYHGIPPARSQEDLDALVWRIHENHFQAAIHANGDREIDMVLNAFQRALEREPRLDHRHRIEHASVTNQGILDRVKDLGVVLALHSYVYEHGDKMEAYGEVRWPRMHANKTALDMGIVVAGNSDYNVSAADPILRIQSLVTRASAEGRVYGPEQRLSVEEALHTFTMGGAIAAFEENDKGSISVGKLADFVVLDADPREVAPFDLRGVRVLATYVGGRQVFAREDWRSQ